MKKYFNIILFTVALTGLSSCLKDDKTNLTPTNSPAVVEWSTTAGDVPTSPSGSTYALYERSFPVSTDVELTFTVNYTGGSAAPEDITANIAIDNDAITQYNEERETRDQQTSTLELLPASYYTIPTSVVIKKGERKATITAKLNSTLITNFDAQYVLALKIATVSNNATISGNYGTILVKTLVKNKYDGAYNVSGTMTDATSSNNVFGDSPREMYLVTKGASKNAEYDPNLNGGTYYHFFSAGGAGSYFGNTCPVFTFDNNDAVSSVVNLYTGNSQGREIHIGTGSVNKWTIKPVANTQTLEVQYIMSQGGTDRVTWTEKWVYKGPRP